MEREDSMIIPVHNETDSFTTRTTRDGRNLRYELKVLQQPVRARACGSGSKSSADRRPVDPPPIVQLKVLEMKPNGGGEEIAEDITFMMNANYFLFATLEPARHMAQARGMPDPNKPTVLTGTPVAGMVYLDRPHPAGYFIFPDLSVRHEGFFRLSFSLYEELKNTGDHDKIDNASRAPSAGDNHVTHRLEVKSQVLQVFSAKKFPGLTESTTLSRTVAEQGCRVRIRRDVRMRKTGGREKPGKDWDEYEDETANQRAKMSRTPEVPPYSHAHYPLGAPPPPPVMEPSARPRSASNGSHQSLAASLSRRQSQQELAQMYQQQQQQQHYGGTAPQTPQSGITPASAYGPSPSQQFSQPPYMQQQPQQQQQPMQPPPTQYQPHSYPPPAPQQSSQYNYQQPASAYQPPYASGPSETNGHTPRASVDWNTAPTPTEYHRPSIQHAPAAPTQAMPAPAQPASYSAHPYQQTPAPYQTQAPHQPNYYAPIEAQSARPPPLEPIQPPTRTTASTTPLSAKPYGSYTLPPISHALEPSSPAVLTPSHTNSYFPNSYASQTGPESHKRSYGSTFSTAHHDMAQKAGARPDSYAHLGAPIHPQYDVDEEDDDDDDEGVLTAGYKRADGQVITRKY